jgi:hypothetical protein
MSALRTLCQKLERPPRSSLVILVHGVSWPYL